MPAIVTIKLDFSAIATSHTGRYSKKWVKYNGAHGGLTDRETFPLLTNRLNVRSVAFRALSSSRNFRRLSDRIINGDDRAIMSSSGFTPQLL